MPVIKQMGELLRELQEQKRSGALFVAVKEKSENLVRIFFAKGEIRHMSYGNCSGRDCLEIVDCYDFTSAYFVNDMKAPAVSPSLPTTSNIIELFDRSGRSVTMQ